MTGKLRALAVGARLKRFKRKGRRFGSHGYIPTNKRNGAPARLLPAKVVDYYQPGKQNRRNVSFLDGSNSSLFELGEPLDNRAEAHKIQVQVARFSFVNGQLYKCSLDEPYLKCLTHQQG